MGIAIPLGPGMAVMVLSWDRGCPCACSQEAFPQECTGRWLGALATKHVVWVARQGFESWLCC